MFAIQANTLPRFTVECTDIDAFLNEYEECIGREKGDITSTDLLPRMKWFIDSEFREEFDTILAKDKMWSEFRKNFKHHFERTLGLETHVTEELRRLKMSPGESASKYLVRFQPLQKKAENLMSEEEQIRVLTRSLLPPVRDHVIERRPLNIADAYGIMRNYDKVQRFREEVIGTTRTSNAEERENRVENRNHPSVKEEWPLENRVHQLARDMAALRLAVNAEQRSCWNCGQVGHIARDCQVSREAHDTYQGNGCYNATSGTIMALSIEDVTETMQVKSPVTAQYHEQRVDEGFIESKLNQLARDMEILRLAVEGETDQLYEEDLNVTSLTTPVMEHAYGPKVNNSASIGTQSDQSRHHGGNNSKDWKLQDVYLDEDGEEVKVFVKVSKYCELEHSKKNLCELLSMNDGRHFEALEKACPVKDESPKGMAAWFDPTHEHEEHEGEQKDDQHKRSLIRDESAQEVISGPKDDCTREEACELKTNELSCNIENSVEKEDSENIRSTILVMADNSLKKPIRLLSDFFNRCWSNLAKLGNTDSTSGFKSTTRHLRHLVRTWDPGSRMKRFLIK